MRLLKIEAELREGGKGKGSGSKARKFLLFLRIHRSEAQGKTLKGEEELLLAKYSSLLCFPPPPSYRGRTNSFYTSLGGAGKKVGEMMAKEGKKLKKVGQ